MYGLGSVLIFQAQFLLNVLAIHLCARLIYITNHCQSEVLKYTQYGFFGISSLLYTWIGPKKLLKHYLLQLLFIVEPCHWVDLQQTSQPSKCLPWPSLTDAVQMNWDCNSPVTPMLTRNSGVSSPNVSGGQQSTGNLAYNMT